MLPTVYQRGGFDDRALTSGQRRFYLAESDFFNLVEQLDDRWGSHPSYSSGMALHSLRAVEGAVARSVVERFRKIKPNGVIHIHAAEQTAEIQDCLAATGKRPLEWLLDNFELDEYWCVVHATHLTADECQRLADSNATVGLCPTTEANLGDGIFPAESYFNAGGSWAIGTDSQIGISIPAELRMIELAQRLSTRRRAVICRPPQMCGETLYQTTLAGGRRAIGLPAEPLAIGQPLNLLVVRQDQSNLGDKLSPSQMLDRHIFCEPSPLASQTIINGTWR